MKNIMKSNYRYIVKAFMAMAVIAGTTSCDDFLDREPMSSISPETYYSTACLLYTSDAADEPI